MGKNKAEEGITSQAQTETVPALSRSGQKALKLLLELPREIRKENKSTPAYLTRNKEGDGYTLVARDEYFPRDGFEDPVAANVITSESCQIQQSVLYEGLTKIRPGGSPVIVHGRTSFRYKNHEWGPVGFDYLTKNEDETTDDDITLVISLSRLHMRATLTAYRGAYTEGQDMTPYAKIERPIRN